MRNLGADTAPAVVFLRNKHETQDFLWNSCFSCVHTRLTQSNCLRIACVIIPALLALSTEKIHFRIHPKDSLCSSWRCLLRARSRGGQTVADVLPHHFAGVWQHPEEPTTVTPDITQSEIMLRNVDDWDGRIGRRIGRNFLGIFVLHSMRRMTQKDFFREK